MQESMRFYHVVHSMKKTEIPLSYIRDKNKFKSKNSLFLLIQCFKIAFCYIFYSMFQDYYLFHLVQYFKIFHLSHTQKTLCISIHRFYFYSFIYTCPQPFIPSHLKYTQIKNDIICIQSFNDIYITLTLQFNLILTPIGRS